MAVYNLYVDESGSFRDSRRSSVVCGVLENTAGQVDWDGIRRAVSDVLPLLPYPFHANMFHEPMLWVALSQLKQMGRTTTCSALADELSHAVLPAVNLLSAELSRAEREPIQSYLDFIKQGKVPDKPSLMTCRNWMRARSLPACQQLEVLTRRFRDRLEVQYRRQLAPHQNHLMAVAAVATAAASPAAQGSERQEVAGKLRRREADDFTGDRPDSVRRDGYVRALETVLERVLCMLRGDGECRLNLFVASRYVELKGYGTLKLGRSSVLEIAKLAAQFPELPASKESAPGVANCGDISIETAAGLVRFDEGAPMGLVLADYLNNRLYHELRRSWPSLHALSDAIRERVGLRLEASPRHPMATAFMPTIAWDGSARAAIRRSFVHEPARLGALEPVMNKAQAVEWTQFARQTWEALSA